MTNFEKLKQNLSYQDIVRLILNDDPCETCPFGTGKPDSRECMEQSGISCHAALELWGYREAEDD